MGKEKLQIAPRPTADLRLASYKKRVKGIQKKVKELSILCQADVCFLSFSPNGKASLFLGEHSNLTRILERFLMVDPRERERRRNEILRSLRKSYKGQDPEVDARLLPSEGTVEEYHSQLRDLQEKIAETNKKLMLWNNPDMINDLSKIQEMKAILLESLGHIRRQKARLLGTSELENPNLLDPGNSTDQGPNIQPSGGVSNYIPHRSPNHPTTSEGPSMDVPSGLNLYCCHEGSHIAPGCSNPNLLEAGCSAYQAEPDDQSLEVLDNGQNGKDAYTSTSQAPAEDNVAGSNLYNISGNISPAMWGIQPSCQSDSSCQGTYSQLLGEALGHVQLTDSILHSTEKGPIEAVAAGMNSCPSQEIAHSTTNCENPACAEVRHYAYEDNPDYQSLESLLEEFIHPNASGSPRDTATGSNLYSYQVSDYSVIRSGTPTTREAWSAYGGKLNNYPLHVPPCVPPRDSTGPSTSEGHGRISGPVSYLHLLQQSDNDTFDLINPSTLEQGEPSNQLLDGGFNCMPVRESECANKDVALVSDLYPSQESPYSGIVYSDPTTCEAWFCTNPTNHPSLQRADNHDELNWEM